MKRQLELSKILVSSNSTSRTQILNLNFKYLVE